MIKSVRSPLLATSIKGALLRYEQFQLETSKWKEKKATEKQLKRKLARQ